MQEFDEYDGAACVENCLTQLRINPAGYRVVGSGAVTPTLQMPLADPQAGAAYYESIEGMLIHLSMTASVVAPTSYGAVTIIPASEPVTRVLRYSPQQGMPLAVRYWLRFGGIFPPDLIVGSAIAPFSGPLTWSFGGYMAVTQPGAFWTPVYTQPLPGSPPAWPAPDSGQFSVATFNTSNSKSKGELSGKL